MARSGLRTLLGLALLLAACDGAPETEISSDLPSFDMTRAVRMGHVAAVAAALEGGVAADQRLAYGATALALAVDGQNEALVSLLLAEGADPDAADDDGATPLSLACELGGDAITALLLDAGADVNTARPDGVGPLAVCAGYSSPEIVARMIAAGAEVDHVDSLGQTPLMWAAAGGKATTVGLLAEAGADPNRASAAGFTPLFFAIKSQDLATLEAVLAAGGRDDHVGPKGTTAAQLAVYQKNFPAVSVLVERGADVAALDRHGHALLHAASAAGEVALIELLVAKGADVNQLTGPSTITYVTESNFGVPPAVPPLMPPLLVAAGAGRADAMEALLAAGADPSFVAANGTNVTHAAAPGRNVAALEVALRLAPDANALNGAGSTPLHLALYGNSGDATDGDYMEDMLRLLASKGARIDIPDAAGNTAMVLGLEGLSTVRPKFAAAFGLAEDARAPTTIAGVFVVTRATSEDD